MMSFKDVYNEMKRLEQPMPPKRIELRISDARTVLWQAFRFFASQESVRAEWLPEYEQIAAWLMNNEGRGLFMFGNCGRGKSLLGRYVLPAILLQHLRKVVSVYDMQELNRDIDGALRKHIISLDDVGTEELSVKFGEKRQAFAEVMDAAEKYGKLLIISTNLSLEDLRQRYGDRVIDRIRRTTRRVAFNGKSLRK